MIKKLKTIEQIKEATLFEQRSVDIKLLYSDGVFYIHECMYDDFGKEIEIERYKDEKDKEWLYKCSNGWHYRKEWFIDKVFDNFKDEEFLI